jgi:Anthrax toxin lethal factor, N- and C-terminal domain
MALLRILVLLLLLTAPAWATGQTTTKPAVKPPVPRVRPEQTPGYQPMVIEGFTVIVSKEAMSHKDDDAYERKPLEVLGGELKTIAKIMPPKALNLLRNILIWVEWDNAITIGNGRPGNALATYYGGHQKAMLAKGMHPLQARNITVHRLKSLTIEHQPKRDSGRCIILHEIAHAVHDQLLSMENIAVKSAYKQAMERKLLEPNTYASTNEAEFFAEMTCAYFDQLYYYPRTKADLKKHDAVTFKLMESTWGKTKSETKIIAKQESVDAPPLRELEFGQAVLGPRVTAETLEGRPCLLIYWNGLNVNSQSCFTKIAAWDAELVDFGLVTAGIHMTGMKPFAVKPFAEARGLTFAVGEAKWTQRSFIKDFKEFPQCLVYGADGQCVYRGSPFDAETPLRCAVGAALLAAADTDELPQALVPIAEALHKGKAPATIFARLTALTRSMDEETAQAAQKLLAKMTETGRRALDSAEPMIKDDPLAAFFALERLPTAFKDTPIASKATEHLAKLKQTKPVALELKARAVLTVVKKVETELASRPGSFDPSQPKFRKENAAALRQLEQAVQQMKRTWPSARATEQARRIAEKYGVNGP